MGQPFPNEKVFLLDEKDQLVSEVGVQGEICVSGTALALGYLGRPDLTAAAFVQNPLNTRWLEPIYRTGDLASYDADGNLVYASRKDHQIKHLGQRGGGHGPHHHRDREHDLETEVQELRHLP